MGARSNIVVQDGDERVYLYGHWMACSAVHHAAHGLRSDRFDEAAYLARIVFCAMVGRDTYGETGFGISTKLEDNQFPLLIIDVQHRVFPGTERGRADVWFEDSHGERVSRVFSRKEFLAIADRAPRFDPNAWPEDPDHLCAYELFLPDETPALSDQISDT